MTHENADTMVNCEILSTETAKIQNQTVHLILLQSEPQGIDSQMKHSHLHLSCPKQIGI